MATKQAATYGSESITTAAGERFSIDNDYGAIQLMSSAFLAAAARGEVDLQELAKETLASRGQDQTAAWVGFKQARRNLGLR